jgi:TRAP-type uncharacterized transport system substrate-binding protein
MQHPIDVKILAPGQNWLKIGSMLALGLDGYYSPLPKGSTVSVTTFDPGPACMDAPRLVAEGRYHMAITTPVWYGRMAMEGKGFFDRPLPIRAIAAFPHDDRLVFAVKQGTGIRSLRQIVDEQRPLKVSTPTPEMRHPAGIVADEVLKLYGASLDHIERWGGKILRDRPRNQNAPGSAPVDPSFDAIFDEAIMTRRWKRLTEEYDLRFLPVDDHVLSELVRRGMKRGVLARGRLRGVEEDVATLDFSGWLLLCHAEIPDELAYLTVAALDEQAGNIQGLFSDRSSGLTGTIELSQACRAVEMTLHPGAEAYYREKKYL